MSPQKMGDKVKAGQIVGDVGSLVGQLVHMFIMNLEKVDQMANT